MAAGGRGNKSIALFRWTFPNSSRAVPEQLFFGSTTNILKETKVSLLYRLLNPIKPH